MARPTSSSRVSNVVASSGLTVLVSFCLLILPTLFGSASGQQEYIVGGTNLWTVVPDDPNFFEKWQAQYTFRVGDQLDFQYLDSNSVVVQVSEADYEACTTDHALLTGNPFEMTLDITGGGTLYVVDSNPEYCKAGLKLKLTAVGKSAGSDSSKPVVSKGGLLLSACLTLVAIMSNFILS